MALSALARLAAPTVEAAHPSRAARPRASRAAALVACALAAALAAAVRVTVCMPSLHHCVHVMPSCMPLTVCECVRAHLACHVGVRVHARFTRMRHVRMRMERERERERGDRREREERERGARGASTAELLLLRQDAARPGWVRDAGYSDTALRGVNLDTNARGPADHEHLGRRLQRGGAPRRLSASGVLRPARGAEGA